MKEITKLRILKEGEEGYGILLEEDAGYMDISIDRNKAMLREGAEMAKDFLDNPMVWCILQRYDVPNKNGRTYPKERLMRAVEQYQSLIDSSVSMGEVDHADSTSISLMNVGLIIKEFAWEGNTLLGLVYLPITRGFKEMGICSNPADMVANLLLHKFKIGISSRSIGSLKKKGSTNEVQDDIQIICWDFVATPSTHYAYAFENKEQAEDVARQYKETPPEAPPVKSSNQKLDSFMKYFK